MELKDFFEDLSDRAFGELSKMDPVEQNMYSVTEAYKGVLLEVSLLEIQLLLERKDRNRKLISASWMRLKVFGDRAKLFEKYKGDKLLKERLLSFLNG